jgi:hypothetical protein|tara:strand:+ start:9089 stop:9346 length:258 start_codon:yes stop_codon:yes gene_type:complete
VCVFVFNLGGRIFVFVLTKELKKNVVGQKNSTTTTTTTTRGKNQKRPLSFPFPTPSLWCGCVQIPHYFSAKHGERAENRERCSGE